MHAVTGNSMHMSVDAAVDNGGLPLVRGIRHGGRGQIEPRPAAVDELVEVAGQPLLEVIVLRAGADRRLDGGRAVHAEGHGPYLPLVALRGVIPSLHDARLAGAGVPADRPAVDPFPFRTARVRASPWALLVSGPECVQDERPLVSRGEPPGLFALAQPAPAGHPGPDRRADMGGQADRADPRGDDRDPDIQRRIHSVRDGAVPQPG